mgnify:CR=1 FL=1
MPDMNKLKAALPEGVSVVMIVGALEDSGYSIEPPIMTDEGEPVAPSEQEMSEEPMEEESAAGDMLNDMPEENPGKEYPEESFGDRMNKLEKMGY